MMDKEQLFMAIHQCDDRYVEEAIEEIEKQGGRRAKKGRSSVMRGAVIAACCLLLIGTGVTVVAADTFQNWLKKTFFGYEVTKVSVSEQEDTGETEHKADIEADENDLLQLKGDVQFYKGDQESFICETSSDGDNETVKKVYRIWGNGLKQLDISQFRGGDYDGIPFHFDYAVIEGEILGFHQSEAINQVYPVLDGDSAYVELLQVDGDTVTKGCIAKINLKTGAMEKITDDDMICNTFMAPGGKRILCNHRSDGYWTVLDLSTRTETRLEGVNGYLHTDEISFIDEDRIFTMSDEEYEDKRDGATYIYPVCCVTDLRTGKIIQKIKDNVGDFSPEWNYKIHGNSIEIYNLVTKQTFIPDCVTADNFHGVSAIGDYLLLWKSDPKTDDHFLTYIWNTSSGKGMDVEVPKEIRGEVEIYLAASEQKLLVLDRKEAYFIDISELQTIDEQISKNYQIK